MGKSESNSEFDRKTALVQRLTLVVEYTATLFVLDTKIYLEYRGEKPRKREIAPGFLGRWRI